MTEDLAGDAGAEFVGAFAVTFVATGALVVDGLLEASASGPSLGLLGIAAATGLAYVTAIQVAGSVSGGHVNPAVSLSAWLTGRLGLTRTGAYIVAQLAGGVAGVSFVASLAPDQAVAEASYGATTIAPGTTVLTALTWEIVLTFLYGLVVFRTLLDAEHPSRGAFAVGGTVTLAVVLGHAFTGASLNPARSLGPAVWERTWTWQWIYLAGPVLGAALAGAVHDWVFARGEEPT